MGIWVYGLGLLSRPARPSRPTRPRRGPKRSTGSPNSSSRHLSRHRQAQQQQQRSIMPPPSFPHGSSRVWAFVGNSSSPCRCDASVHGPARRKGRVLILVSVSPLRLAILPGSSPDTNACSQQNQVNDPMARPLASACLALGSRLMHAKTWSQALAPACLHLSRVPTRRGRGEMDGLIKG